MPIYEYEHQEKACYKGAVFEVKQSLDAKELTKCPWCGRPVKKIVSPVSVNTPKTDTEVRDAGFTKLVRRDDGVYENVTPRKGEPRLIKADDL
jgi:putative FmdB family regulatory protein